MKRVVTIVALLTLLSCSLASLSISLSAPRLAETAVSYASQPPSASDIITQQRQRVTDDTPAGGWLVPVLLLAMAGILAFILTMFWREKSAEYLKQRRLAQRQQQRPLRAPLIEVPPAPAARQLPSGEDRT